jgi:quinol monooxygenase YgiN
MTFVQMMTFRTGDIDAARHLNDEWRDATEGKRTLRREVIARDHENPGNYVVLAYFDSYESAMQNSQLPETEAAAEQFRELSDEPMTFRNLDIIEDRA